MLKKLYGKIITLLEGERKVDRTEGFVEENKEFNVGITDEAILQQIQGSLQKKTGFLPALILFLVSVALFMWSGFIAMNVTQVLILTVVLFVHELSHLLAMKACGYSNTKIFFLPFLGAVTTGQDKTSNGTKEALVTLAGPFFGILIGVVLAIACGVTRNQILYDIAVWFLWVNGFNLLPLYPLDGGSFFNTVLCSRNYALELFFKIATSIILFLIFISSKSFIFLFIPIFMLASLRVGYYSARAAKRITKGLTLAQRTTFALDKESVRLIRESLREQVFAGRSQKTIKYMSVVIHDTWKRITVAPPGLLTTLFLIGAYCVVLFLSLTAFVGLTAVQSKKFYSYTLSSGMDKNNKPIKIELLQYRGKLVKKTELDEQFRYHGRCESYTLRRGLSAIGYFYHGSPDGQWMNYETQEILKFDKGKCILVGRFVNGRVEELPWEKMNSLERRHIERWIKAQGMYAHLRMPDDIFGYIQEPTDTQTIIINPMGNFNFLKKQEIFDKRKQYIFQYPELANSDYQVSSEVFGRIEGGRPWWGIMGRSYYGDGKKSIEGVSVESLFIANPYLLVGLSDGAGFNVVGLSKLWLKPKEAFPLPTKLIWAKDRSWAKVTYDVTGYFKFTERMRDEDFLRSILWLHAANARDLGFGYLYVDESASKNIESLNSKKEAVPIPFFYHNAGSCGYPGGCNNISPIAPDFDIKINVIPAFIYIKLWKNAPAAASQPADMTYIIEAR